MFRAKIPASRRNKMMLNTSNETLSGGIPPHSAKSLSKSRIGRGILLTFKVASCRLMGCDELLTHLAVYQEHNSMRKTAPGHWNWHPPLHPHCLHRQRGHRRSPSLCTGGGFYCEVRRLLPGTLASSSRPPAARALCCAHRLSIPSPTVS